MSAPPPVRWQVDAHGSCDMQCEHASCQAWQRASGHCLLCARPLDEPRFATLHRSLHTGFAYRTNGTGASHLDCRLNQLAARQAIPRFRSENGEFQIGMPQSDDEVLDLQAWAAAARRFEAAIESVLTACEGSDIVPLPQRRARGAS